MPQALKRRHIVLLLPLLTVKNVKCQVFKHPSDAEIMWDSLGSGISLGIVARVAVNHAHKKTNQMSMKQNK